MFEFILNPIAVQLIALQTVVQGIDFGPDPGLIGGDVEQEQSKAVVLDGQIEIRDHLFCNRQQHSALFEQNVGVVFFINV